jgi:hypothetical protein
MVRHSRSVVLLAVALTVGLSARGDETIGKGVTLTEATPIQKLYQQPADFVGKTIRVDGVVSAVCEAMGCWMAIADVVDDTKVVRFKVDHGAGIVFPISAKGKAASAEGLFEKIAPGDAEAREAAAEHTSHASGATAEFGQTYQITATGAVIR